MECPPNNVLLQLHQDTFHIIRKNFHLDKPGEMKEAVIILKQWVEMQPHFTNRDFSDNYLELCIVRSKGSIEKAKQNLDKLCTLRTLVPQLFSIYDAKKDLDGLFNVLTLALSPKLTKEHHRVFFMKTNGNFTKASQISSVYLYAHNMTEYITKHDYVDCIHFVIDLTAMDIMNCVSKLNMVELSQSVNIYLEGFKMKIKGIHLITASKTVDVLINVAKRVMKPKVTSRIHVYKTCEELHSVIGKDVLTVEFGGNEKSIYKLHMDWVNELSSEENVKYLREMKMARTNETLRPRDTFIDVYAGTPGTFRIMSID